MAQKLYSSQDLQSQSGQVNGILAADFDNDGDPDIVFGDGSVVPLNENGDSWVQGPSFAVSYPRIGDIAVADFDNDGSLDITVTGWGDSGSTDIFFLNENLEIDSSIKLSSGFSELQLGDLNNDGNIDIVTGGRVSSILNHGERIFSLAQELNVDNLITEVFLKDIHLRVYRVHQIYCCSM